ncbi:putative HTH-type transcriptional regulator [Pseudomonas fluorescens]|nr:putative HTH-type transcriptional regulator [Pseudomonas fluorescens]
MTGDSEPKASRLVAIAKTACVDIGWLVSGEGSKHPGATLESQQEEYDYVPLYDAHISQGHGAWNEGARILTMLAFTKYSLRKKGLLTEHLAAVRVAGDSNEPVLSDGDTVMVDLRRNQFQGEGFYVIRLDDLLYAKRLQRQLDGGLMIISANSAYQPLTVPGTSLDTLHVVGRIVWSGGWMI